MVGFSGTSFGPHLWTAGDGILNQHIFKVEHKNIVNRQFLYWMLKKAVEQVEENLHGGVGLVHITKGNLERIEIPVPAPHEQDRMVTELEGYRKIIEGARQVIANYKPTIRIDPHWPTEELGQICQMQYGYTASAQEIGDTRFVRITDITAGRNPEQTRTKIHSVE